MALAVGDHVYLDATDDFRADPPLFGVVDSVTGTSPSDVKVNWENGLQEFFTTAMAALRLVEILNDPSGDQFVGRWVDTDMGGSQIMRSFLAVDSGNARTFLVRTQQDYYFVGRFAFTYPTKATSLADEGEPV